MHPIRPQLQRRHPSGRLHLLTVEALRRLGVAALAITLLTSASSGAGDVALIVHPKNPVADLTRAEVVAIFKAEQQHWKAGERIYLILQESGTPERALLLKRVYLMSDVEIEALLAGEALPGRDRRLSRASWPPVRRPSGSWPRPPTRWPSSMPPAVDSTVKALRIDGQRPGEPGYALAAPSHLEPRAVSVRIRTKFLIIFFRALPRPPDPHRRHGATAAAATRSRTASKPLSSCAPRAPWRRWTASPSSSRAPPSPGPDSS